MSSVPAAYRCGIHGDYGDRDIVRQPDPESLQAWQHVWRKGIVPQLTVAGLEGLKKALEENRRSLLTGATTFPPPLQCMQNEPVEGCCPLCYALLDGNRPEYVSVGALEERFAEACFRADQLCGEPGAIRWFLNAIDEWSRPELLQNLLREVNRTLAQRAHVPAPAA
jgi:hypothetical protein